MLDSITDGLRLRFGDGMIFDGGWNELTLTRLDPNGFAGVWESTIGLTTYRAAGHSCARRKAPAT